MTKDKLGLPLEYKELPEYFDASNVSDDTQAKNSLIESLLEKHSAHSVLDLTCGTGSQVFYLASRGYNVTGADFSPALLEIARQRARSENVDVKFIDGDMRTLQVGAFDAVITIFNAVGHLTKAGFEKAMQNIHKNLKDGGIYVFDIFNLEAMTDKAVSDFAYCISKKVNDGQMLSTQCSTIDRQNSRLTSYDCIMIQRKADKPTILKNKFSLQIYSAQELRDMLARSGFKTVEQCGMDGAEFDSAKTINILTVARKG